MDLKMIEMAEEVVATEIVENVKSEGQVVTNDISDEEETVVTIDGESPTPDESTESAAPWVKELRKNYKDSQKVIRELQEKLKAAVPEQAPATLSKKPTLEACEYDAEKFEADLEAWHEAKRHADSEAKKVQDAENAAKAEWDSRLADYNTAKAALKVSDFSEVEDEVRQALSITQQGIIVQGATNSALVVLALGKNPKKRSELAAIKDPVKFAFAVAKLENQLKVSSQKKIPEPEKVVVGSGAKSATVDSQLETLRANAAKSGNMAPLMEYKRKLRQQAK